VTGPVLSAIWVFMIAAAVVAGGALGRIDAVTAAAMSASRTAVDLVLSLTGLLCLWMGLMKVAERSGLTKVIARLLSPLLTRLFPEIPPGHPVMSAMVMSVSANLLGLGNAATPFGLKAMAGLAELAPDRGVATRSMITFLALCTSSVTLIPATVIGLRAAAGAAAPSDVVVPSLIASSCATAAAVITSLVLGRLPPRSGSWK
jgi:spore maturation protein A